MKQIHTQLVESLGGNKTGIGFLSTFIVANNPKVHTTYGVYSDQKNTNDNTVVSRIPYRVLRKLRAYGIYVSPRLVWPGKYDHYSYADFAINKHSSEYSSGVIIHDLAYLVCPETIRKRRYRALEIIFPSNFTYLKRVVPHSIKHSDIVYVTTDSVKNEVVHFFGKEHEAKIKKLKLQTPAAFAPNNEIDKDIVFFQATLEPRKNHMNLLAAYSQLPAELRSKHPLMLAGGLGWQYESTLNEIEKLKREGVNVEYLGYVSEAEKITLYQRSKVYVQPSFYEGLGMPILEAQSCGARIACSDIPVFREICKPGADFFNPNSVDEIRASLVRLLT